MSDKLRAYFNFYGRTASMTIFHKRRVSCSWLISGYLSWNCVREVNGDMNNSLH